MPTLANLIDDYQSPDQPDDCKDASKAALVAALRSAGPVVHRGAVVSCKGRGKKATVDFDAAKAAKAAEGAEDAPAPDDEAMAKELGLPLARDVAAPDATGEDADAAEPEPPADATPADQPAADKPPKKSRASEPPADADADADAS